MRLGELQRRCERAWSGLFAETDALPLDLFRILAGCVCLAAFTRNLLEVPDFGGAAGLVDHALGARIGAARDPFIRLGLFQPGMPDGVVYALYSAGAACAVCLLLGIGVRFCAFAMWLIGVSAYRWNYLIANVDDYGMNVVMFWLALLPLGRTLTLRGLLRDGRRAFAAWTTVRVPGLVVRLFLINVAMIYVVAGTLKWTSPFWREGFALFAVLRMPIAWNPDLFTANNDLLVAGTYVSLLLEPLVPVLMCLPAGHIFKWGCLPLVLGLHLGIALTLEVPFINLALMGVTLLYFRSEIMQGVRRRWGLPASREAPARAALDARAYIGCAAIGLLLLHFLAGPLGLSSGARRLVTRTMQLAGIQQGYALFNWVDERGNHVVAEAEIRTGDRAPRPLPIVALWPNSMRADLMLSYLIGRDWMPIADASRNDFNAAVRARTAARFCAARPGRVSITASARITRTLPDARSEPSRVVPLLRFGCEEDGSFEVFETDPRRAQNLK